MKAAVYRSYGPPEVLKIEDVETPVLQEGRDDDRVLIKVHSASVNPFDYLYRSGYLPVRPSNGLLKPKDIILGIDVAGTVLAIGKTVIGLHIGDAVFGSAFGSHAEYIRARARAIIPKPIKATFQDAAALPTAGQTALQALRDVGGIKSGQRVLINGAGGGVGHMAVQLAKHYGAEVTAVCGASNQGWVKALGADHMVDYSEEDFTKNGQRYDIILDAAASRTYYSCRASLTPSGVYITENPLKPGPQILQVLWGSVTRDQRVKTHLARPTADDLFFLRELVDAGKLRPVIERTYPFAQIAEAHRHVETGHTKGKVVVEIGVA